MELEPLALVGEYLDHPQEPVRQRAVVGLAALADENSLAQLVEIAASDPDPSLRQAAESAIHDLSHDSKVGLAWGIDALLEHPKRRRSAVALLARLQAGGLGLPTRRRTPAERWQLAIEDRANAPGVHWQRWPKIAYAAALGAILGTLAGWSDSGLILAGLVRAMAVVLPCAVVLALVTSRRLVPARLQLDRRFGPLADVLAAVADSAPVSLALGLVAVWPAVLLLPEVSWWHGTSALVLVVGSVALLAGATRLGTLWMVGVAPRGSRARRWQITVGAAVGFLALVLVRGFWRLASTGEPGDDGIAPVLRILVPPVAFALAAVFADVDRRGLESPPPTTEADRRRMLAGMGVVAGALLVVPLGLAGRLEPGWAWSNPMARGGSALSFTVPVHQAVEGIPFRVGDLQQVHVVWAAPEGSASELAWSAGQLLLGSSKGADLSFGSSSSSHEFEVWLTPGEFQVDVYDYDSFAAREYNQVPPDPGLSGELVDLFAVVWDAPSHLGEVTVTLNSSEIVPQAADAGLPTASELPEGPETVLLILEEPTFETEIDAGSSWLFGSARILENTETTLGAKPRYSVAIEVRTAQGADQASQDEALHFFLGPGKHTLVTRFEPLEDNSKVEGETATRPAAPEASPVEKGAEDPEAQSLESGESGADSGNPRLESPHHLLVTLDRAKQVLETVGSPQPTEVELHELPAAFPFVLDESQRISIAVEPTYHSWESDRDTAEVHFVLELWRDGQQQLTADAPARMTETLPAGHYWIRVRAYGVAVDASPVRLAPGSRIVVQGQPPSDSGETP